MKNPFNCIVAPVKCQCGDKICKTHGLNVGTFYQGAGWSPDGAQFIATAINSHDELLEALKELQRETIAAARRAKSSWPLSGSHPAKALYDKVEAAIAKAEGRS